MLRVCKVSGAQFLSRMGYSLEDIQLIGRWGSDAVKRYIQEAPLAATPMNSETADNNRWRTLCGWHYGTGTYPKTFSKPTESWCRKCFREDIDDDRGTSSEDELT